MLKKTKFMLFFPTASTQPSTKINVNIHITNCQFFAQKSCTCKQNNEIELVDQYKYLGVVLDSCLKWKDHIIYLTKRLRQTIPKFYDLRDIVTRNILMMVYKALIQSILQYALVVWGGAYSGNVRVLNTAHKYILKTMLKKNKTFSTELLYYEAEVLPLRLEYVLSCVKYYHNNLKCQKTINHPYNTRSNVRMELTLPKFSKSLNLNYYKYVGIKHFNNLPLEIRALDGGAAFARGARDFIVANRTIFMS